MSDKLDAALIAAAVSIVGSALTLLRAQWQLKSKIRELEQAQLKEGLEARLKAYPKVWLIFQEQISNWRIEGKHIDGAWAKRLYEAINSCHATYGVLFSQPVYDSFCAVRESVGKLATAYNPEQEVPVEALTAENAPMPVGLGLHHQEET